MKVSQCLNRILCRSKKKKNSPSIVEQLKRNHLEVCKRQLYHNVLHKLSVLLMKII